MSVYEASREKQSFYHERAEGIGGSEIAIILGIDPYCTPYRLWLEKSKKEMSKDISGLPHVQRGIHGEIACRSIIEFEERLIYVPKTWRIEGTVFRCSDDGWHEGRNEILEIKCIKRTYHEQTRNGAVPEFYRVQCQWNLMVSKATQCRFISFVPETRERVQQIIKPDPIEWEYLKGRATAFWQGVLDGIPPPPTDKDIKVIADTRFDHLSQEWIKAKTQYDALGEKLSGLECQLKKYADGAPAVIGKYAKVIKFYRKGQGESRRIVPIL